MTPQEFAAKAVGLPWRRWRSDWQCADCWGLVVLYHREVLGLDLGDVPHIDIATGYAAATGWEPCAEADGVVFMCFRAGEAVHCGIVLGAAALHAQEGHPISDLGSTRLTPMSVMRRLYQDIRFYRRAPCP